MNASARRVEEVLPKRFAKYGLALHPEKTRLVRFRRPSKGGTRRDGVAGLAGPETFDFLGFTHHWAKAREGAWVIKLRTSASRISRTLRRANEWCRRHRHQPVPWQRSRLSAALLGFF